MRPCRDTVYAPSEIGGRMRSASPALAILLLIVLAPLSAQAASVPPAPDEDGVWVIDAANVLSSSQFNSLNTLCNDLYLETGRPIVVLTKETVGDYGWYQNGEEE